MKNCVCIKPWKDYNIGDQTFYLTSLNAWFVGGNIINPKEFKEHFKPIE